MKFNTIQYIVILLIYTDLFQLSDDTMFICMIQSIASFARVNNGHHTEIRMCFYHVKYSFQFGKYFIAKLIDSMEKIQYSNYKNVILFESE